MAYQGYVQNWCDACKTTNCPLKYLAFHDKVLCSDCRKGHICDLDPPYEHTFSKTRLHALDPNRRLKWMARFARQLSADTVMHNLATPDAINAEGFIRRICPAVVKHALWIVLSSAFKAIGPGFAVEGQTSAEWVLRPRGGRALVRFTVS
ncbi:uncharacterized protein BDZ99DRAFT_232864 [Mytilinidion resinicola]|uniref:Uncharacterized protein n=1 Tax=Mytilinidion resinicola TaxID=574789 RepID=A0A6A6Z082_9PEZI|nr:uncharacterized protein BDZ99DRAFT_232864 [Mytilinidion resinicola]KAF2814188.1 hypothetical protein BDZ99DRAFT_232864 [Mytilinidion resinicola]